jgi:uncharacterized repeat protein (TIGR04044 family)
MRCVNEFTRIGKRPGTSFNSFSNGACHARSQSASAQEGDFLVDYEEKGSKTSRRSRAKSARDVPYGCVRGIDRLRQPAAGDAPATQGFETSVLLYGPGVTLGLQRGFPTLGDEAFPGHLNFNKQLVKFMEEGGKVYACRFALQALYGHGEASLIEGIRPINPLDVLDIQLLHRKENALVIHTWTV